VLPSVRHVNDDTRTRRHSWIQRVTGTLFISALFLGPSSPAPAGPAGFSVVALRPAPAPTFERVIGGTGRGALADPFGVAADGHGNVWVADRSSRRVEEFTPSGTLVTTFGEHGTGALLQPDGVAVGPDGNVWVSDTGHNRIVEFSPHGTELRAFGSPGSGPGQLDQPQDLAAAPGGDIYVADQANNRIEVFSASGGYLASISVPTPYGVALGASGNLWVSSPSYAAGNAVYEFSATGSQLREFGSTQSGYGALSNPGGLAVGPGGRIYVAQPDYGWVTVFNPDGSFYTEFGLQSNVGHAREDLAFPQDLAITASGQVWVADSGNGRMVEFTPPGGGSAQVALAAPGGAGVPRGAWWALVIGLGGLGLAGQRLRRHRTAAPAPPVTSGPATSGTSAPAPDDPQTPTPASPQRLRAPTPTPAPAIPRAPQTPTRGHPGPAAPASGTAALLSIGTGSVVTRRRLLTSATAMAGAGLGAAVLPLNLRKALARTLANPPKARLADIKNIVILMQENRSFDHYFGTMPGVRGFSDPTAIRLPNGNPVFYQPDPSHAQGYLLPFHYDTKMTSAQATPGTDHSWPTQHQAWNNGAMDAWIAAKGPYTMGYFAQQDIPFHWALAQAFTICDNYHCSVLGPTDPNRLNLWTGMIDPNGTGGGPIIDNTPAFNNVILSWTTYPERLQRAGISWQVYQEEDNYDDNALAWFTQYANAPASSPLRQRGIAFGRAGDFEADARADRLPQVSWLVAPTAQTEHPDYFPAAGAEYIAQKLDAIASNPDVWAKTAFILCYDENDGLFDHVVPPTPPAGTPAEFVQGEPIGLGFRTPTTVVSPWTAGGFVCSDVFDHTSLIRFIEARFGVHEPNISAWRRQTCGDLTSAFRFSAHPARYPYGNTRLQFAAAEASLLAAQQEVNDNPAPAIPAVNQPLPRQ
jgi:phospholipase C